MYIVHVNNQWIAHWVDCHIRDDSHVQHQVASWSRENANKGNRRGCFISCTRASSKNHFGNHFISWTDMNKPKSAHLSALGPQPSVVSDCHPKYKVVPGDTQYLCFLYHLIFYVTRFSIGWKIGVILCHPKKIYLWRICSNVTEYSSAIEYSAEINHET
jgi:hypothetical protein